MTPNLSVYRPFRGLPTLAGLASLADAARPGMGVGECVERLKRFHYAFVRLHEILTARITAEPGIKFLYQTSRTHAACSSPF